MSARPVPIRRFGVAPADLVAQAPCGGTAAFGANTVSVARNTVNVIVNDKVIYPVALKDQMVYRVALMTTIQDATAVTSADALQNNGQRSLPLTHAPHKKVSRTRGRNGTAGTAVLAVLKRDLLQGVYLPRERLVEADLVERYRTTRAAVREALMQLTTEGMVERTLNRGARVRAMSVEEAIEIAEVRRMLETFCAGRAAKLATASERRNFLVLAESLSAAGTASARNDYLILNARYHANIIAMARHSTAGGILDKFQHRPIDRFFPGAFAPAPPSASVHEHERLTAAIVNGDAAEAEAAMYEHLSSLIETLRQWGPSSS
jgi:DNA-binding GntR family transcriptional regulator